MKSNNSASLLLALFIVLFAVIINATNVAIPYPLPPCNGTSTDACVWETVNKNADTVRIVVISPLGKILDQNLLDVVVKAQLLGITVLVKVQTGQGKRALIDVKADIDLYLNLYKIDGVFFDQIPTACTVKRYYSDLYAYVKVKLGGLVILNVGLTVPECFTLFADVLVLFDSTYTDYLSYVPPKWCAKYPHSSFWHVIRGCPPQNQRNALLKAIKNKVGFIYITADVNVDLSGNGPLLTLDLTILVRLLRLLNLDFLLDNLQLLNLL
jgi:hypothetical protein